MEFKNTRQHKLAGDSNHVSLLVLGQDLGRRLGIEEESANFFDVFNHDGSPSIDLSRQGGGGQ